MWRKLASCGVEKHKQCKNGDVLPCSLWPVLYTGDFCCNFVACTLSPRNRLFTRAIWNRRKIALEIAAEIAADIASVNGPFESQIAGFLTVGELLISHTMGTPGWYLFLPQGSGNTALPSLKVSRPTLSEAAFKNAIFFAPGVYQGVQISTKESLECWSTLVTRKVSDIPQVLSIEGEISMMQASLVFFLAVPDLFRRLSRFTDKGELRKKYLFKC